MILGILCGILLDKLMYLILAKMFGGGIPIGFYISTSAISKSFGLFGIIFLLILFNSIRQIDVYKRQADKLSSWGFESNVCNNFRNILTQFLEIEPHLVLMDISLPFFNGYHWCSEIRKISKVPIMFISSAGDKMNIVMAINMGADDFVSKPFDMDMLLAKIQALLRRTYDFTTQQSGIFQHDNIILNSTACTVTYHDNKLELSKNENKILTIPVCYTHLGPDISQEPLYLYRLPQDLSKKNIYVSPKCPSS